MEKKYYVYVLCRPDGRPFYVGKGQGARIFHHEKYARQGRRDHKSNIIRKIWRGGGEVQRYVVFTTDDEAAALAYERELIALHGRGSLANLTDGGEGPVNLSPELRARLSEIQRALWADPDERRKRSEAVKRARSTPESRAKTSARLRGHPVSDETREKIRAANRGNQNKVGWKAPIETRQRQSAALRGVPRRWSAAARAHYRLLRAGKPLRITEQERQRRAEQIKAVGKPFQKGQKPHNVGVSPSKEVRRKISETLKASAPWRGRKHTEESIQKMRDRAAERGRVYKLIAPDGTIHTTHNMMGFCREHGLSYSGVQKAMAAGRAYKGWRIS